MTGICISCAAKIPIPSRYPTTIPPSQRPYQINGVWYFPIPSAEGYVEKGIASWYGEDFHGKPTSSGETYDMYGMTAAHKILPLGTHVKVTNLLNNRSVIVRVNDRGPFVAGRVIDLAYTPARLIGIVGPGTAPVLVEAVQVALPHDKNGETVWDVEPIRDFQHGNFTIQIGAFQNVANALKIRAAMLEEYSEVRIQPPSPEDRDNERYFRVQVGRFTELSKAQYEAERLKNDRFPDAFVVAVEEE
ncbi:MAG: septal ring lytic transglycosylase RlpA family protein [Desulfobacterota bacterium]|nr:septal ring lytic transglycosylase RlpA family protein [Thermodesulfobacteriota bacterium]